MIGQNEMTNLEELLTGLVVKVVLLRHDDARIVPMHGATPVDFTADVLSPELVAELVDSATTLDAPGGVPMEIVRALLLESVPAVFARTPWLRGHRALTFTDTGVPAGGHILRYQKELGVYVDEDA